MSYWGKKFHCETCKKELSHYERCPEYMLCNQHKKNYVPLDHVKQCNPCKVLLNDFPKCCLCSEHNLLADISFPSTCTDHKYCFDCLNGISKHVKHYRTYLNNPTQINKFIDCSSCQKFFKSLTYPPEPPNCYFCGMFAINSEVCKKHQYCKDCKTYLQKNDKKKIDRIKNCRECFQEFSEHIENQQLKKAIEESKHGNKGNSYGLSEPMHYDRDLKNPEGKEHRIMDKRSNNYHEPSSYLDTNNYNGYDPSHRNRPEEGRFDYQDHQNYRNHENKGPFSGGIREADRPEYNDYLKMSPTHNEGDEYKNHQNHFQGSPEYGFQAGQNFVEGSPNQFNHKNELNRVERKENPTVSNPNYQFWDHQNPNKEVSSGGHSKHLISNDDKNDTSSQDDIYKNYIDPSVMFENMLMNKIEDPKNPTSNNVNETEKFNKPSEFEKPSTMYAGQMEPSNENLPIAKNFNNLPALSLCILCGSNQGDIVSTCGHSFCKFCFFTNLQYPYFLLFIENISNNRPLPEIFTYRCPCNLPLSCYYPMMKQLDFINWTSSNLSLGTVGDSFLYFTAIVPYIKLLQNYSFYLEGLPCKFESCKNCNSKQYAAVIESQCYWCNDSFINT